MAEGDNQPVVIRKRRKGHGGHAHHGGAWKVAYADFVTAMMAFFLLLWLLSTASDEQKKGIADYFSPVSVARESSSGSGGLLGGETITSDGAMVSDKTPFGITMTLPADDFSSSDTTDQPTDGEETPTAKDPSDGEERGVDDKGRLADVAPGQQERALANSDKPGAGNGEKANVGEGEKADTGPDEKNQDGQKLSREQLAKLAERKAEQDFKAAVQQLRQAVSSEPELADLAKSLVVDRTAEGMRLQIVDQQKTSMFQRGSAMPEEKTKKLFALIAKTLAKLPNKIAIKGHTDSVPYRGDGGYSNWELSSDRALASRRALIDAGLDASRIADVVGKADTEPLVKDDPTAPQNRRISIVLLNQPMVASAPSGTAPSAPGPTPEAAPGAEHADAPEAVPSAAAPALQGAAPSQAPAADAAPAALPSPHAPAAADPATGAAPPPAAAPVPALPSDDGRSVVTPRGEAAAPAKSGTSVATR
ncbi:chemotaxis protein MotB [Tistlia consotensis]|uniref:Chemotaxis protein MotB n=1 Tax=Tistlia consotensis USBA 355 TaxID=560819 RepID=A0A1Y6BLQ3_9PROT|nr:flagellar motor protein MotB [Tistlia consotensis]SMF18071.1 chemotaxis protein MotB [Tistlia consotensis USBA 355]SNR39970.1 chemotaxis protein MotB [Tistlia consotensis]